MVFILLDRPETLLLLLLFWDKVLQCGQANPNGDWPDSASGVVGLHRCAPPHLTKQTTFDFSIILNEVFKLVKKIAIEIVSGKIFLKNGI